jgi:hypothetical protein
MSALSITFKDLLQLTRDFKTFMFLLIMPVAFTLLFGYAFGGFGGGESDSPALTTSCRVTKGDRGLDGGGHSESVREHSGPDLRQFELDGPSVGQGRGPPEALLAESGGHGQPYDQGGGDQDDRTDEDTGGNPA